MYLSERALDMVPVWESLKREAHYISKNGQILAIKTPSLTAEHAERITLFDNAGPLHHSEGTEREHILREVLHSWHLITYEPGMEVKNRW